MVNMDFNISLTIKDSEGKETLTNLKNPISDSATLEELLLFLKKSLIQIATDVLKDEQSRGFDKNPVTIVDNSYGKKIEDVKPVGKIEFVTAVPVLDILKPIYDAITQRSPKISGTYANNNYVFHNGVGVATNQAEFNKWLQTNPTFKENDIVRFMNMMPYAGRLERLGKTGQRQQNRKVKSRDKKKRSGSHIMAANGVYFLSFRSVQRVYSRNAFIKFEWINGSGVSFAGVSTKRPDRSVPFRRTFAEGSRHKGSYVYPCITVRMGKLS